MKYLVEKFQCPGCVCGSDAECGKYNFNNESLSCGAHVLGTHFGLGNLVALGLPKGFNKPGFNADGTARNKINVCFFEDGNMPEFDDLNIPVWAMEMDGFLFIRLYSPRVDSCRVAVIEKGSIENVPGAVDVANFIESIH